MAAFTVSAASEHTSAPTPAAIATGDKRTVRGQRTLLRDLRRPASDDGGVCCVAAARSRSRVGGLA
ncbi:hypothetical protein ACFOOK_31500 [Micromonospora krabiensis]|uniref:hypothetical protein n=1 Tax=Micromonospora krabiensis TaxID=307121 RepID=UPI00360DF29D